MASLPSLRVARLSFAWRLGFLYAALFLVVGCYLPYLPVWLSWRRLDADQIAVLLAAPLFTRILFTPAISFATDWLGDRRKILSRPHDQRLRNQIVGSRWRTAWSGPWLVIEIRQRMSSGDPFAYSTITSK